MSARSLGTIRTLPGRCLFNLISSAIWTTQENGGFFVRRVLQPFLDEAGLRLRVAGLRDPACLSNPLGMQRGIPLLVAPSRQTLLDVQCLINQLMLVGPTGSPSLGTVSMAAEGTSDRVEGLHHDFDDRAVAGAVALWQGHLLWGNLPLRDLEAITLLAGRTLGPALYSLRGAGGIKVRGRRQDIRQSCEKGGLLNQGLSGLTKGL